MFLLPLLSGAGESIAEFRHAKAESSVTYKSLMLSQSCASQTSIISLFQLNRSFTLLNSGSATNGSSLLSCPSDFLTDP